MRAHRWFALFVAAVVLAGRPGHATAEPPLNAVVRLPSHGASATVIETRPGYSLLLGCAHAFEGKDRTKPIHVDVPTAQAGAAKQVVIRLLTVDYQADLSLVELHDGPLVVAPVAPAGHKPSGNVLSIGYDEMKWPFQVRPATILGTADPTTFTRERPWHGRSGGALLDAEHGCVIGVVQGYETAGQRRGVYVSHATILRFLAKQKQGTPPRQDAVPFRLPAPTCPHCPQ